MTAFAHEKHSDAMSLFTVAKIEGVSYPAARDRANAGAYGPTFHVGRVWCAHISELLKRGIITEQDVQRALMTRAQKQGMQHALLELLAGITKPGVYSTEIILLMSNEIGRICRKYGIDLQLDKPQSPATLTKDQTGGVPQGVRRSKDAKDGNANTEAQT
jgi:hypothetical protein